MQPFLVVNRFQKVTDLRSGMFSYSLKYTCSHFGVFMKLHLKRPLLRIGFGVICLGSHDFVSYGHPALLGFY